MKFARSALLAAALLVPAVAFAAIGVNKTFNPINVSAGQSSTLTVILINNNPAAATAATFTDTLPGTVVIATPANASTTCVGGTVTATSGNGSFSFSGGTIPAAVGGTAGQCTVQVDVNSITPGVFINTIPANAATSSQGANAQAASATLTVAALRRVTGVKAFAPTNLHGGGTPSTVTMTLTNPNGVALTAAAFTDTLPVASLAVAPTPNASTTCGAGTVTTTANTASLSGGTIPANGSCIVRFDVVAANPNVFVDANVTNSILINALTTAQGVSNSAFSANVRLQTGARVEKSFAPSPITTGGTSTLTVTVRNFNATPLSGIAFTDTLPGTMRVAAPVTTATTCASLAFTPVPIAGDAFFTVSGGTLLGAPAAVGNTLCTVTIDVTATNAGLNPVTLTNTVPAGNFGGVAFSSAGANLVVNAVTSVGGSKAFVPAAILQGQISTMTITLTNSAAVPATITAFTDLLTTLGATPQFTVAAAPPAVTSCGGVVNAAPGVTTITLGAGNSIPATGSCTITVPVQASATASTGARTNTIAQGALQTDQGRTQTTITGVLTVNHVLTVAKAFAPATVAAGADTRLTITLTRAAGAPSLSGLAFTDTLPAGHVVSATPNLVNNCGGLVTAAGNSVALSGGSLAGGVAATTCTILVNITTPAGAGAATNTIAASAVTSTEGFRNPEAANATITRVVTNVTLNKSFSPATVLVGGTSTLTINILNNNANAIALTATALTDTLPVGMAIAAVPLPSNTCGGALTAVAGAGTVTLSGGSIAANATCRIQVNVVANASGNLINTLGAGAFTSAQGVTNPLPAQATLAATGSADLAVTKTDGVGSAVPGTTTTYTIVAINNGPNNVAGAGVVDTPPAGMTFTGWTCVASAGSACGNASGSGPINELVTLIVNGTATFTVTAAIAPTATGTITNTATVVVPGTVIDTVPANNSASDTDTLTPQADLTITKTDGVTSVVPGTATTYTIVVTNNGPSNVVGATVTDLMPAAIASDTFTAVGSGGAAGFSASGSGSINDTVDLLVGATVTYTVVANVASNATGTLANTATVAAPAGVTDSIPGNNSSTDTDTLTPQVTLFVAKDDGSATYTPGGTATYTVTVTDTGVSDAADVTVNDLLPPGLTLTANVSCTAIGSASCGLVTGSIGGISFGTTGATIGAGSGNSLVFNVPVAFASGMVTNPLVNTATATDIATGATASGTDTDNLATQVTLAVVKTDGSSTYTPGGTATYTVTITHGGLSDATNVTVNDPLPAGVTLTANASCVAIGAASCGVVTGLTGQSTFGTTGARIAAGAGNSIVFTAPVAFAPGMATDPLDNTATAVDQLSGATGTGTDSDARAALVTLAVSKNDSSATYTPGGGATYLVSVTNTGVSDALNVTVGDLLPIGVLLSGNATCAVTGSANCGTVTGSAGQASFAAVGARINAGAANSLTFTVPVSFASNLADNPLTNTATADDLASGATGSASDIDTLAAQADLSITKSDGVINVVPGTTTTYTIVVANSGPSDVVGATVSDVLPAAVASDTFTAVGSGGATGFTASGSGNINDTVNLPVGSTITYTLIATISGSASGNLTNTATVAAPAGVTEINPANNSATDTDTLTPQADLAITKTDGVTSVAQSGVATYTIVVTNNGPSAVVGATVSDPMPAAIVSDTFTAIGSGGATGFTASGSGNINDTVNLPAGSAITYTVVANIGASAVGNLVNTATVTAPGGVTDTNPGNNSATDTDTITLTPVADLAITKTDGSATYTPGGAVTYAIVVSNAGPAGVIGATVVDALPAAITGANWTCVGAGGGTCPTSGSGNINVSVNLPAGASVTFTLTGTIAANATGNLVNTATVGAPAGTTDPNPGNNSATDTDTPTAMAGLAITKTDGSASYAPGGTGTYTITVTNNGPSNANSVSVTDNLPAGVTLTGNATCVATGAATCGTVTGSTGGSSLAATGATIAAGAGNSLVFTLPVRFANGMTTNPLVNIATANDPASQSVTSASDSNVLMAGPSNPIPVDNRWALALLAGLLLLGGWRQSRGASLRKRM